MAWLTSHVGWPCRRAWATVHGDAVRHSLQPNDQNVLSATYHRRKSSQGGHHRLHAQAADHSKRHAQNSNIMEDCPAILLTVNTVALWLIIAKNLLTTETHQFATDF